PIFKWCISCRNRYCLKRRNLYANANLPLDFREGLKPRDKISFLNWFSELNYNPLLLVEKLSAIISQCIWNLLLYTLLCLLDSVLSPPISKKMNCFALLCRYRETEEKVEKQKGKQRSAPLEPTPSVADLFQESQSAVELRNAQTEKLVQRVVIPVMEPSKKWRKFPYSPQWVSILDVAQKILDEEDKMKKKHKENKAKEKRSQPDKNFRKEEIETEEEQMPQFCDLHSIKLTAMQPLLEQLPSPKISYLRAEKEILTAKEIEDIIQEIVALRAKERLSEEATSAEREKFFSRDIPPINAPKPCYHWDWRLSL
ncbi:uncharacterized protein LOC112540645, partial [Python bivittatus]|uniref:Uncharacterized protein LOC112540645 n=1 Tax=Python bivittatus TaxID=176946 RepID=A0A9F5IN07_PYTBI